MLENVKAIEAWNTVLFDKFTRFRTILTTGLARHGHIAIENVPPRTSSNVLDLGCGFGDSTIDLARLVGKAGTAHGVDAAPRFIAEAIKDAKSAEVGNATFATCDVQTDALGGPYDYVFSRFGTMFFANPVAALRNVRKSMTKDGEFHMVVWRRKSDNEFMYAAETCVKALVPPREDEGAVTCGPGPFSMADADTVTGIMGSAGFSRVSLERIDLQICIGRDAEDALAFAMALGPAGEVLRLAGELPQAQHDEVVAALREVMQRYARPDGVWAGSSSWVVSGRA